MPVERTSGTTSLLDVLDRVLDGGIRVEARDRAALRTLSPEAGTPRLTVTVDPHRDAAGDAPVDRARRA